MTSPFSWSDTVKIAFISCLPCLKSNSDQHSEHEDQPHNPTINRIPRARPDELQGLLADVDTDVDAETLSLHTPGRAKRNMKKKRTKRRDNPRRITFFGYNLFGRPIQLPDEDDALFRGNGNMSPSTTITAHSTSTFDSDAAPLDSDTIAALSSSNTAAAAQTSADIEAQRLKEKEERRKRRREKKLKRLRESMAAQGIIGDGDVFEGFQGSGGFMAPLIRKDHSRIPSATFPGSDSGSGSAVSGSAQEYGPFVAAPSQHVPGPDDDQDDVDLDGGVYAHKKHVGKGSHGSSDSRSRTSTSTANRGPHRALPNPSNDPAQSQAPSSEPQLGRKRNSRTSATTGTSTTSQSPSLPSPMSSAFSNEIISPSTVEHGQGFFDADNSVGSSIPDDIKKPVGELPTRLGGEIPMTGFRGLTGVGVKGSRDLGAFLAIRGDEDKKGGM